PVWSNPKLERDALRKRRSLLLQASRWASEIAARQRPQSAFERRPGTPGGGARNLFPGGPGRARPRVYTARFGSLFETPPGHASQTRSFPGSGERRRRKRAPGPRPQLLYELDACE